MTQEEKARAYDEALKRAKAAIDIAADKDLVAGVVRTIFPEPRESEDERIMTFLLDYAIEMSAGLESDISLSTYDGIKGHDPDAEAELTQWQKARAYLEKQKEQKPVDYDHEMWKNCEANFEGGKKEVIDHPEKYGLTKQKPDTRDADDLQLLGFIYDLLNEIEWKDNWAMSKDECLRRLNNYRPQKLVEWSEEDKHNLSSVINLVHTTTDGAWGSCIGDRIENWLKNLPERFNLQPKQEWSDEDEKLLNKVEVFLDDYCDFLEDESSRFIPEVRETISRLKSLRSQKLDASKLENFDPVDVLNRIKTEWPMAWEKVVGKQEWSEEDKEKIVTISEIIEHCTTIPYSGGTLTLNKEYKKELLCFIKSLRPQPKDEIYKEKNEAFKLGKHQQLAIKFMNYLDENRPAGKMSLSNAECEDIDKAFKENDWERIMRYTNKYAWKPSKEQMVALNALNCHGDLSYIGQQNQLISLYNDLKKLM